MTIAATITMFGMPNHVPEPKVRFSLSGMPDTLEPLFSNRAAPCAVWIAAVSFIGMVPAENLEGRALFTIWSTDGTARWLNPASWWRALRPDRIGHGFR